MHVLSRADPAAVRNAGTSTPPVSQVDTARRSRPRGIAAPQRGQGPVTRAGQRPSQTPRSPAAFGRVGAQTRSSGTLPTARRWSRSPRGRRPPPCVAAPTWAGQLCLSRRQTADRPSNTSRSTCVSIAEPPDVSHPLGGWRRRHGRTAILKRLVMTIPSAADRALVVAWSLGCRRGPGRSMPPGSACGQPPGHAWLAGRFKTFPWPSRSVRSCSDAAARTERGTSSRVVARPAP